MNRNGLTISMIFEAQSANYGEGIGNISVLKKMSKGSGDMFTYISRQAIRYNIIQQLGWDNTPVADAGVVQFAPEATIKDYPEIDLFGYMKTTDKDGSSKGGQKTRSAVARLSNAVSLEPYCSDLDFLTNMGLAKRKPELQNAIAQSEIHNSFYAYTITIDLDKVGIDENDDIKEDTIDKAAKADRVVKLLETIEFLYRDIKGRRENLAPLFAVGGIYERKNPYFEGRLEMSKGNLNIDIINEVINSSDDTRCNTTVGVFSGKFKNADEIKTQLKAISIGDMFDKLRAEVTAYYA